MSQQLDFLQRSLDLRAARAEVIAGNIANADTPGYKAVDFDFAKALEAQTSSQDGSLGMTLTNGRHMAGHGLQPAGASLQYRSAVQRSIDGNSVDMDVERSAFTDNALKYQSTLTFLGRRISGLMDAIKGGQ
ncbi:flagellar basal body rod protein FlgB [Vogesella oryzae]|uniref:flagellar basal body rod protein FlgB n=1 Tax=Vogesella oryzae TaxID=1735285 RepID=UPI001FE8BC2F|nr:flagellar basal body rod protein FlgB [Vogesella oryzae]